MGPGLLLEGSWAAMSRVTIMATMLIAFLRLLRTLLTTTHEPSSREFQGLCSGFLISFRHE